MAWGERLTELAADVGFPLSVTVAPTPGMDLNEWSMRDPAWTVDLVGVAAAVEIKDQVSL